MKNKRVVFPIAAFVFICTIFPASAQKTAFADVPKSHWAYAAYSRLVKAKLAGYPSHMSQRNLRLTRYEFAVMIQRLQVEVKSPTKLTEEQRKLLPIIKRMAREFAPEIKELGR